MDTENQLDKLLSQYKYPLIFGFVGLVLLIGGVLASGVVPKTFDKKGSFVAKEPASTIIKVDVSGAVASPGVYILPGGARLEDAIKAAGGLSQNADPDYISKIINLAQKLTDGSKVYVPVNSGSSLQISPQIAGVSAQQAGGPININLATLSDLDSLSGVGTVTAQKIIDGRPYQQVSELLSRKIIFKSLYDKIKDRLVVY